MFIPWPKDMPCPVPSSHPARYEWTLDSTGLEDMTVTEELVEWIAQSRGYLHHPSAASNSETSDGATSATSTKSHGKTVDHGGKRVSEAIDQGGKRVSKGIDLAVTTKRLAEVRLDKQVNGKCSECRLVFDVLDSCLVCGQMLCNKCLLQGFHASCIAYPALDHKEAGSSSLSIDKCGSPDANLHMALTFHCEEESACQAQRCCVSFQPTNDPPPVAGCAICGGVDPMYGGTMSCPHCEQNLCPVCFPPTQHEPCRSSLSSPLKLILLNAIETSSQYPFRFDTCGKGDGKKTVTIKELDNSMSHACRRNGVTKRGTSSHRGQGSGAGGGGGGDDKRNHRKPLPEDAYEHWMEDELARIIERILDGANARFLGNMPPYPDAFNDTDKFVLHPMFVSVLG